MVTNANKFIFILLILMLTTMASAKTYYYQDKNIGLITVDVKESLGERILNLLSTQSFLIAPEKKSVQVGEEVKIQVITQVPCEDRNGKKLTDSDISVAKFVITDPTLSTSNFDIKGKVGVCQSNQLDFTITPQKVGKYQVHYIVMQNIYPQLLVKEVNDFTAIQASPTVNPVPTPIPAPTPEISNDAMLSTSECTQDIIQPCTDNSKITAYKCSQGKLVSTQEQCKTGNQGAQGEIPLQNLLFSLEFYGIYSYIVIALGMIITLVLIIQPKKRRR